MSVSLDDRRDVAAIHPLRFWTEYVDVRGELEPHDWVEWVKKGDAFASVTGEKIARVKRDAAVWAAVEPHYAAWKKGQDAPVNGIPLDAVPFVSKELATVLRRVHILSVEDLANAEDAALSRLNIPGIRTVQGKARTYLQAQTNMAGVLSEMAAMREALAAVQAENAELAQARDQLAAESGRRRRSRDDVMATASQE